MKKGKYRICRVVECYPDERGLVRTVLIESRPYDSRETSLPYKSKALVREKMSVQRLVFFCSAKDVKPEDFDDQDVLEDVQNDDSLNGDLQAVQVQNVHDVNIPYPNQTTEDVQDESQEDVQDVLDIHEPLDV